MIVLHGPPGVGKTLTAESVAEYTQKPLYPINIGELTAEQSVVQRLQDLFLQASRWDAVLLLDEADVVLEKRSYEDLRRNGIVSGKSSQSANHIMASSTQISSNNPKSSSECWNIIEGFYF